jgi:ATP-dependent DNA helicase RecG
VEDGADDTEIQPIADSVETGQKTAKSGQKSGQKIMEIMRESPDISTEAIAAALGIVRSAVTKHIQKLKAQGRIRRTGPDKGGYWEVVESRPDEKENTAIR